MGHDLDIDHEHEEQGEDNAAISQLIWEQETLQLRTVGIDIGSSTSHLLFARVTLQRQSEGFSSRFVVVGREVLWRSPIRLTPFLADGTIDAHALDHFIHDAYHDAGLRRGDIDSGAVILTGEAIKRKNARAIDELFARESGKFVCATAGHEMECLLAAHGSGATAISARRKQCGLHVDIGGGTTKLALIDRGTVVSVAAFAVGGRLLARDAQGAWSRIDDSARQVAQRLGVDASPEAFGNAQVRDAVCERLARVAVDQIVGAPLDELGQALELTAPLSRGVQPQYITFSGGVSEYIFARESGDFGDIAAPLAAAIVAQLKQRVTIPIVEPAERIRATVIGASQFTVQVSGKTIHLPDAAMLPIRNLPVVHLEADLSGELDEPAITEAFDAASRLQGLDRADGIALSFEWQGEPEHARLLSMARAIKRFAAPDGARHHPLVLVIDGDVASSLGRILRNEVGLQGPLAAIDGVQLKPLDFVDVGELVDPPGVVPVVIKSLLFGSD